MEFIFDANQDFQLEVINAIVLNVTLAANLTLSLENHLIQERFCHGSI